MKRINLLPKTDQRDHKLYVFGKSLIAFWVWVLGSLVIIIVLVYLAKSFLNYQAVQIGSAIDSAKKTLQSSDYEIVKQQIIELNGQIAGINSISTQHYYWTNALSELSNLLAEDLHMTAFGLDRESGMVVIKGIGSRASVLKFWEDIHKSPYFKDINFPLANLEKATDDNFSYTFYLVPETIKQP